MGNYLNVPTDAERNYQKRIVDSKGRTGPTLQRIADQYKTHKNNTGMLEAVFEVLSPLSMYSGEAEGAYIPSKAMQSAQGLAKVFQDWYKTGTPTINVPMDKWPEILKSGKFKNQMELAGKNHPEAWRQRMEVEKALGGFPYPRSTRVERPDKKEIITGLQDDNSLLLKYQKFLDNYLASEKKHIPEYSESLAKQNPIYGHIYNSKYNDPWDATGFGNTHAEMSDLVKERSKYILGDSFHPFVKKAFSSQDMSGKTSALERALFDSKRSIPQTNAIWRNPTSVAQYMEMWVPNALARINNIKSIHIPKKASLGEFDQAVAPRKLPSVINEYKNNYKTIEDSIPDHLKDAIGPEDLIDDIW